MSTAIDPQSRIRIPLLRREDLDTEAQKKSMITSFRGRKEFYAGSMAPPSQTVLEGPLTDREAFFEVARQLDLTTIFGNPGSIEETR
jgi:hypothetical protein